MNVKRPFFSCLTTLLVLIAGADRVHAEDGRRVVFNGGVMYDSHQDYTLRLGLTLSTARHGFRDLHGPVGGGITLELEPGQQGDRYAVGYRWYDGLASLSGHLSLLETDRGETYVGPEGLISLATITLRLGALYRTDGGDGKWNVSAAIGFTIP